MLLGVAVFGGKELQLRNASQLLREGDRWTVVVLTCRQPSTDFRFALARELAALGHEVHYVFLKRRPSVRVLGSGGKAEEMSLKDFALSLRKLSHSRARLLVLNSTNLAFPGLSVALRLMTRGTWCLDLHDDLLYERSGWDRRRAVLAQMVLTRSSDFSVHSAGTLAELFPRSHHLGNASDVTALPRDGFDARDVLVLASLDGRFDFAVLTRIARASPEMSFHIHGQVSKNDPAVRAKLDAMLVAAGNITYHGAYANSDLPALLGRYSLTLAPYVIGDRLTRYIDPLRFYHCLNAGMELVSTDIPAARDLQARLHVIRDAGEFRPLARRLADDGAARRNFGLAPAVIDWRSKAVAFMTIVARETTVVAREPQRAGAHG